MSFMIVKREKWDAALSATADAIRAKTGGSEALDWDLQNETGFAAPIAAIPAGGTLQAKTALSNGVVLPDSGYDGLSSVTVSVPEGSGVLYGVGAPAASLGSDGNLYLQCNRAGTAFTCSAAYLVEHTTQLLATHSTAFYKTVEGPAIGVHWKDYYNRYYYYGPILVSTVADYVKHTLNSDEPRSAVIDGTTWYIAGGIYWNLSADSPSVPTLYDTGLAYIGCDDTVLASVIRAILTAANAVIVNPDSLVVADVWCKSGGEWDKLVNHVWPITE